MSERRPSWKPCASSSSQKRLEVCIGATHHFTTPRAYNALAGSTNWHERNFEVTGINAYGTCCCPSISAQIIRTTCCGYCPLVF